MRIRKAKFLGEIYQLVEENMRVPKQGEYFLYPVEDVPWKYEIREAVKDDPFIGSVFYIYKKVGWGEYYYRKRGNLYEIKKLGEDHIRYKAYTKNIAKTAIEKENFIDLFLKYPELLTVIHKSRKTIHWLIARVKELFLEKEDKRFKEAKNYHFMKKMGQATHDETKEQWSAFKEL